MARYVAQVRTPRSPLDVFEYMADLRNVAAWDPSIRRVVQIEGVGGCEGAEFDVTVRAGPRDLTLRYRTESYSRPERAVVVATSTLLRSEDTIVVESVEGGTLLTYDAELQLRGPLRVGDPFLQRRFQRIGEEAAAGLLEALDGELVEP